LKIGHGTAARFNFRRKAQATGKIGGIWGGKRGGGRRNRDKSLPEQIITNAESGNRSIRNISRRGAAEDGKGLEKKEASKGSTGETYRKARAASAGDSL